MAEIHFPDVSSWNPGISLAGWPAVCAKATEGTGYLSPQYEAQKAGAARHGAKFAAYHFLHAGNGAGQADYCHGKVGGVPLMLDVEETSGSVPGVGDITAFTDRYRAGGGVLHVVYLPEWYWKKIGSPSLAPLISRGLALVSSVYPAAGYTANGPGWASYGGMTPSIWQYTSTGTINGMNNVDLNCYRGTLDGLWALWTGGAPGLASPPVTSWQETMMLALPTLKQGASGASVRTVQGLLMARGYSVTLDGVYGPATAATVERLQGNAHLAADGVVGPLSWVALMDVT